MQRIVLAAIAACLLFGGGWVVAQQTQPSPVPLNPGILSGADIGFRVEGQARGGGGGVVGTLMVRLKNGEWVEAHGRGGVIPLHTK